ncbi:helix-turn-helix domain-containing protein [Agrobacterium pusense]|uniref:helix-turn-helix domain-containing protein n=1 Tax=Agrobacterium pusense TaxID=648995 RepID=UPI0022B8D112|nr:helix-turn-helix transcriptional regulator [Agrobacterium pusense]MCZ7929527.1 helix-turn-helix transcriptional regulator [Agrobacterium pusense]
MSSGELKALRKAASLPQRAFALEMGVPLRTYENLESGSTPVRPVHLNAAKWALVVAASFDDEAEMTDLPDDIKEVIVRAYQNIR